MSIKYEIETRHEYRANIGSVEWIEEYGIVRIKMTGTDRDNKRPENLREFANLLIDVANCIEANQADPINKEA